MPDTRLIWIDGAPGDALPLPDRGLDFGDGVFETLLVRRGEPLWPELHGRRLELGLGALGFPDCAALAFEHLAKACRDLKALDWHWAALRVTVTRGAGPRGYAPPSEPQPRTVISAAILDRDASQPLHPATLCVADIALADQPRLAGVKHLNRIEQVLAAQQAVDMGADEALTLDQAGDIACTGSGNLFAVTGREIITPPLERCGIRGTRRQLLIERWAPALGLTVREDTLSMALAASADELLYTNALVGVRAVTRIDDLVWPAGPVTDALFQQYAGALL